MFLSIITYSHRFQVYCFLGIQRLELNLFKGRLGNRMCFSSRLSLSFLKLTRSFMQIQSGNFTQITSFFYHLFASRTDILGLCDRCM